MDIQEVGEEGEVTLPRPGGHLENMDPHEPWEPTFPPGYKAERMSAFWVLDTRSGLLHGAGDITMVHKTHTHTLTTRIPLGRGQKGEGGC